MQHQNAFFNVEPGALCVHDQKVFRIKCVLSSARALGVDLETGKSTELVIARIMPVSDLNTDGTLRARPDLGDYTKEDTDEAQRRFQIIKEFIENSDVRPNLEDHLKKHQVSKATFHRWIRVFNRSGGLLTSLIPNQRGPLRGSRRLTAEQETIIEGAISDVFLSKPPKSAADTVREVRRRCRKAEIEYPSPKAIRLRISQVDTVRAMRARGFEKDLRDKYAPIIDSHPATVGPMDVIQIDHTKLDIILVAGRNRIAVGKPWMTLAVDVYSRMVVGMVISYETPAAIAVSLCLGQMILPKTPYLNLLKIEADWDVWGRPKKIYTDNGKDFKGENLDLFCAQYGIDRQFRPAGMPHVGGTIERAIKTMLANTHKLPGTTLSNPQERKQYPSEKEATITLRELESMLLIYILKIYHKGIHEGLLTTPEAMWKAGIEGDEESPGIGVRPLSTDPLRLYIDSLPFEKRSIQRYGIQWDNILYYDPVLDKYINSRDPDDVKHKRQVLIRRDPRDISKLYFPHPETHEYHAIPYRNRGHPRISLYEMRAIRKHLVEKGRKEVDEDIIFAAYEEMQVLTEASVAATKAARKASARFTEKSVSKLTEVMPIPTSGKPGTREAVEKFLEIPSFPTPAGRKIAAYSDIEESDD